MEEAKECDSSYLTKSKIKPYFDHCYKGFDPSNPENFYSVYGALFARLDKEEEDEEMVGQEHSQAPTFGDPSATMEQVFRFYQWWSHFTTLKQFAYADVYNPN